MTIIKRGYLYRKCRTKIRLFTLSFQGAHSRLTRTITQQKVKALVLAHRDRDRKKRDFRRLWINRINAVIRENKIRYTIIIVDLCIICIRGSCFLIVKYFQK